MLDKRKPGHVNPKGKLPISSKQRTLFDLFHKALPSQSHHSPDQASGDSIGPESAVASTSSDTPLAISTVTVSKALRRVSLESRPIHPFFGKSVTSPPLESTRTINDTVVELSDDVPDNIVVIRDTPELFCEGGSQEDPIVLDSPLRPLHLYRSSAPNHKPLAPLFTSRPSKFFTFPAASKSPKSEHLATPYPDRLDQHVRGPQTVFHPPPLSYNRRIKASPSETKQVSEDLLETPKWTYMPSNISSSIDRECQASVAIDQSPRLTAIPNEDHQHPAILRLTSEMISPHSTQRLWADKWHPSSAAEVLGNESNAIYLRDWIRALELHLTNDLTSRQDKVVRDEANNKARAKAYLTGAKRPRVVRTVKKHRGRKKQKIESDEEDDWIVYSDNAQDSDDSGRNFDQSRSISPVQYDEGLDAQPPILPPGPMAQYTFESLTNTILLTGPSGVGKTAAVYACAEELGWDVLEVYPGIGKRNGSSIDSLIGDAGKNHHVRTMRTGNADTPSGVPQPKQRKVNNETLAEVTFDETGDAHTPSDKVGFLSHSEAAESAPTVRQSLILLEEVDIQFKEDVSFWPAVTNFIKDCRRPVVITCNDVSLIPTEDLPLQAILPFQSCPPSLAASYLVALCSAEGYSFEQQTLLQAYEDSLPKIETIDIPDISAPPIPIDFPTPDLRRAINSLQFICSSSDSESGYTFGSEVAGDCIEDLFDWNQAMEGQMPRKSPDGTSADQGSFATPMGVQTPSRRLLAVHHADLISFVDSQLMCRAWDAEEATAWGSCEPSNDDEVGHPILFYPKTSEPTVFSGSRTQDGEIVSAVMWLSRATLTAGTTREPTSIGITPFRTRELFRARVDNRLQMKQALGGVVPLPMLAMRFTAARLDYATRIWEIIVSEDKEEEAHSAKGHTGRRTRNSGGRFERIFEWTPESRTALAGVILL